MSGTPDAYSMSCADILVGAPVMKLVIHARGSPDSCGEPAFVDTHAVPLNIDLSRTHAGKRCAFLSKCVCGDAFDTGHHLNQIEHIVSDKRKVCDFIL